jgi:superfamily II DNA/RNA helicase
LDILTVRSVVHYDVARTVDTFVHRAGRTAVSSLLTEGVGFLVIDNDDTTVFGLESLKLCVETNSVPLAV